MSTINKTEVEKFSKLAEDWWNPNGKFKPLHLFNPARIKFIKEKLISHYKLIAEKQNPLEKLNILDIGCGAGFFLNIANERGWNCHGMEILPEYIKYAQENFALKQIRLESLDGSLSYDANTFDVITLWDLIEHLRNPLNSLQKIYRIMTIITKKIVR